MLKTSFSSSFIDKNLQVLKLLTLLGRIWDIKDTDDYLFPVCIDVQKNPKKNKRGYKKFTKYIRVLNCFDIFAEDGIDDDLVGKKTLIAQ